MSSQQNQAQGQPTNGQAQVVARPNGNAPATEVVNGGQRMPLAETAEVKAIANTEAVDRAKWLEDTLVKRSDLTGRKGILVKGPDGTMYLVAIEPVTKPQIGKVQTIDKAGKELAEPKATFNMSGYGRVSIDTGLDRKARIDAATVGKQPIRYSPPSVHSPATAYEIATANQTAGTTEVSSRDREVLDF